MTEDEKEAIRKFSEQYRPPRRISLSVILFLLAIAGLLLLIVIRSTVSPGGNWDGSSIEEN
jgi:hypothetical protein